MERKNFLQIIIDQVDYKPEFKHVALSEEEVEELNSELATDYNLELWPALDVLKALAEEPMQGLDGL